jgi:hypothetical protein
MKRIFKDTIDYMQLDGTPQTGVEKSAVYKEGAMEWEQEKKKKEQERKRVEEQISNSKATPLDTSLNSIGKKRKTGSINLYPNQKKTSQLQKLRKLEAENKKLKDLNARSWTGSLAEMEANKNFLEMQDQSNMQPDPIALQYLFGAMGSQGINEADMWNKKILVANCGSQFKYVRALNELAFFNVIGFDDYKIPNEAIMNAGYYGECLTQIIQEPVFVLGGFNFHTFCEENDVKFVLAVPPVKSVEDWLKKMSKELTIPFALLLPYTNAYQKMFRKVKLNGSLITIPMDYKAPHLTEKKIATGQMAWFLCNWRFSFTPAQAFIVVPTKKDRTKAFEGKNTRIELFIDSDVDSVNSKNSKVHFNEEQNAQYESENEYEEDSFVVNDEDEYDDEDDENDSDYNDEEERRRVIDEERQRKLQKRAEELKQLRQDDEMDDDNYSNTTLNNLFNGKR